MTSPKCGKAAALIAALLLLLTAFSGAQTRYYDEVFTTFTQTSSIQYGAAPSIYSASEKLRLDLFEPAGDTELQRPAILFMHGGSWIGGQRSEMQPWCETFARRGYVCATIDYRTGIWKPTFNYTFEAGLRASQDIKAAVRWMRAHAAQYRINPKQIFLGGSSAGSMAALLAAYLDNDEIPAGIDTVKWSNAEGVSGSPGYSSEVQGVLNYCGALIDTLYMDAGEPAVACFHGMSDPIVPYESAKSPDFGIVLSGSHPISRTAQRLGITSALAGIPGMGHGVPDQAMMDSLIRFERSFLYLLVSTQVGVEQLRTEQPAGFVLSPNYPNPFNAATRLRYELPQAAEVELALYALDGRRVALLATGRQSPGRHEVLWQADGMASGIYTVVLRANGLMQTRKVALVK
jgi:acetyl esterase/lipase